MRDPEVEENNERRKLCVLWKDKRMYQGLIVLLDTEERTQIRVGGFKKVSAERKGGRTDIGFTSSSCIVCFLLIKKPFSSTNQKS